jgi:hypothetical protein
MPWRHMGEVDTTSDRIRKYKIQQMPLVITSENSLLNNNNWLLAAISSNQLKKNAAVPCYLLVQSRTIVINSGSGQNENSKIKQYKIFLFYSSLFLQESLKYTWNCYNVSGNPWTPLKTNKENIKIKN